MIYLPSYKVQVHRTEHSQEHSVDPDTVVFCNGLIQIYSAGFVKNKELGKPQKVPPLVDRPLSSSWGEGGIKVLVVGPLAEELFYLFAASQ